MEILDVDELAGTVDVEGMASYGKLVDATFVHGLLPSVVPQLKSITIGGACAGLGIEASSFRYGLAHETVDEIEVLLADGDIVVCTPTNAYSDLFFGFPNSFGTLGYALRIKAKAIRTKKFVELRHIPHSDPGGFFRDLTSWSGRPDVDFIDGVVFGPGELYLNIGRFVDEAPHASDYTFENIYYRSIRERERDYLTTLDYIWRWDTDWFWCSRLLHAQNPARPPAAWAQAPELDVLQKSDRLGTGRSTAGNPAEAVRSSSRIDRPGCRPGGGAGSRFSRLFPARDRRDADMDLPVQGFRPTASLPAFPDRPRSPLCQLRILGLEVLADAAPGGSLQSADRAQAHRAWRDQVALFGFVLHAGGVLGNLQQAGLRQAEDKIRSQRVGSPISIENVYCGSEKRAIAKLHL